MKKHCLYRHFDADNVLLYVGITNHFARLLSDHSKHSAWFSAVHHVTVEHFEDRIGCLAAERAAIEAEKPKHNIVHNRPKRYSKAEESHDHLTGSIVRHVGFLPMYKITDAAKAIGISATILKQAIDAGELGTVTFPRLRAEGFNTYITGWQLIDWLEYKMEATQC